MLLTAFTNIASNERSFSCLNELKTNLQLIMDQERLSNFGIVYKESDSEVNLGSVKNKFDQGTKIFGRRQTLN